MIRKFQKEDADSVMQIWLSGNEEAHAFISRAYWKSNYDMVREQILQAAVFVCEQCGEIQGFIGLADHYIAGIFVKQEYQSHGIGKQLLDYVKSEYASLSLHVYQKNRRAAAFYFREGFSVLAEELDESTGEAEYFMVWEADTQEVSR
ncbi:MAG: N-acetyltransferase [Lachnospiraceae bacterium]|jgi:putative acetyltransferase